MRPTDAQCFIGPVDLVSPASTICKGAALREWQDNVTPFSRIDKKEFSSSIDCSDFLILNPHVAISLIEPTSQAVVVDKA